MIEPEPASHSTAVDGVHIVGLGGSAGSIPALQRFFQVMPADSGLAFVVVLHLSPEHESLLSEVLQRSTSMPVTQVEDGTRVVPGHVYVIPPGKRLSSVDGVLRLSELPRDHGRRMTVDLFFRSLADNLGSRAVAIVLSGGDGDGAMGIKRIKERGGLTIAQDPLGAEHSGMPRAAIATSMVDWVLRAEEMPARLMEYEARDKRLQIPSEQGPNPAVPAVSDEVEESALREVLVFLRARTGRDFSYYKRATIVRRVARRIQVNELDSMPAYLSFLRTHAGEAGALLQDLLISVTNFFRDREAFDGLAAVIPQLFRNKGQGDTVRVWVPACATGEEAYSIAMMLSEHARMLDAPPALQVFATDLHEEVLVEARAGFYPEAIDTDVSPDRLRRFFVKEHGGYRVRRELREMVLFAVHDVLKDSPFSRLDLVSCRNMLIYLNRDAQQRVLDIFHFALHTEGRLFLGTSESVEDGSQLFFPLDKRNRIYVPRVVARLSLPVPSGPSTLARALAMQARAEVATPLLARVGSHGAEELSVDGARAGLSRASWSELHLKLIERLGPPSLIVDSAQEILHLSQSATPFLQFTGGEPSTNLLRAIHPALRSELRAALFRAGQSGESVTIDGIGLELLQQARVVDVRVSPAAELAADYFLVELQLRPLGAPAPARTADADERLLHQLERELEQTKRQLRDVVEQHEASIEELKASNEELQAMNEELRSASEELESSREELQSINEELTTVNQELKGKVDEIGHANSDLHNLMGATAIATVFLDRQLRIMRYTPSAVTLFSVIPSDMGRPLADLRHRLDYPELLRDAEQVLRGLVPIERQVAEAGGKYFLARLLPYRTTDEHIAGVVLTFVDVTEREAARAALQSAQEGLERRVQERTAQLDAANDALRQEVLDHLAAEKARQELQRRLVNAQEEERRRISRELHDEVGQQISALMLSLKALEGTAPSGEMPSKLRELRATAEQVGREIQQLAYELRPMALDELGLPRALNGYLDGWQARTGITVDWVCTGLDEVRLPAVLETTLYRVVQEATNNVHKHAAAKNVSVSIERRSDHVLAIVEDDGAGFDYEALDPNDVRRIGLAGMRERVALVAGELTIESSLGHGTTVRVRLPIPAA